MTTLKSLPALPKMRKARAKVNDCACGCGQKTGARFVPGHDSRLRGWMLRLERGLVKAADIPEGERQAAVAALKAAGGHTPAHVSTVAKAGKPTDKKLAKRQARAARKQAEQATETPTETAQQEAND